MIQQQNVTLHLYYLTSSYTSVSNFESLARALCSVWCFTLPLSLVESLQWRMIPAVVIICWALFVIEEVGHLIEVRQPGGKHTAVLS